LHIIFTGFAIFNGVVFFYYLSFRGYAFSTSSIPSWFNLYAGEIAVAANALIYIAGEIILAHIANFLAVIANVRFSC